MLTDITVGGTCTTGCRAFFVIRPDQAIWGVGLAARGIDRAEKCAEQVNDLKQQLDQARPSAPPDRGPAVAQ